MRNSIDSFRKSLRFAVSLIAHAVKNDNIEMAINTTFQLRNIAESHFRKAIDIQHSSDNQRIEIPYTSIARANRTFIRLYALSHRLKRDVSVSIPLLKGKYLVGAIAREFAYLPAMQYMFDTHVQVPAIWNKIKIGENSSLLRYTGSLRGVRFEITDTYAAEFFPLRLSAGITNSRTQSTQELKKLPHSATYYRYLRSIYSYLLKLKDSKISILMREAFGGEINVAYVVRNIQEFNPSKNSVSFFITVPVIKGEEVLPKLNLIARIEMLNGAEIRFVDETVSTYPIILKNANVYLKNFKYSSAVVSPTTLSMLLTQINEGD